MKKLLLILIMILLSPLCLSKEKQYDAYKSYITNSNSSISNLDAYFLSGLFGVGSFSTDSDLLIAVAKVESRFDNSVISKAGAVCMMQIIPKYHLDIITSIENRFSKSIVESNAACIYAADTILQMYIGKSNGNIKEALSKYGGSESYSDLVLKEYNYVRSLKNEH